MSDTVALLVNALGPGGAERVVLTICDELARRGRHVDLVCLEPQIAYDLPAGIVPVILGGTSTRRGGLSKLLALPVLAHRLAELSQERGYRIVQSHLFRANYVNVLSRKCGATHGVQIVNHTKLERLLTEGLAGRVNAYLARRLYPRADSIVAISRRMAADLARFLRLSESRILTIHNPYDIQKVREGAAAPSDGAMPTRPGRRFIMAMGRLVPLKRFEDLIAAFAPVAATRPDVDLVILGEGPERGRLETQAAAMGLTDRVYMPGFSANPYGVLNLASVFALTSETEGFPNAIIEALALGTPVISTDCISGPREILAPGSDWRNNLAVGDGIEDAAFGLLVPVGDIKALTEGLVRVLDDSDSAASLSGVGPGRASEFSAGVIVDAYERLLFPEES